MTISRFDLIAAGASFTIVNSKRRVGPENEPLDKYDASSLHVIFRPALSLIQIYVSLSRSGMRGGMSKSFQLSFDGAIARQEVADYIQPFDNNDADALRMPWKSHANTGWPEPAWAVANGLNLDALLYSAAEKMVETTATKIYLEAGANPLAPTFNGDCAARVGIAEGMIDIFSRPEWLDAACATTGETGLFDLARSSDPTLVNRAYLMGADPDIRNKRGETVLDLIAPGSDRTSIEITIAEMRAKRLRVDTIGAGCSSASESSRVRRF
jgi:hypothetical protein